MSFAERLNKGKSYSLELVRWTDEHSIRRFAFMLVPQDQLEAFRALVEHGITELDHLAINVLSDEGEPTQDMAEHIMKHLVKEQYQDDLIRQSFDTKPIINQD